MTIRSMYQHGDPWGGLVSGVLPVTSWNVSEEAMLRYYDISKRKIIMYNSKYINRLTKVTLFMLGNVLLHEFAHLIWGLPDEYPEPNQSHFYMGGRSRFDPNKYDSVPVHCSQGKYARKGC